MTTALAFDLLQATPESYEDTPRAITMARILQAFMSVFGLPPGRVSTEFRAALQKTIDSQYPNFRCSTARAVLEGRIPGVPSPVTLHREQKQLKQALFLLDALETMAAAYIDERLKSLPQNLRSEVEVLRKTMGSAYVPGILTLFKENPDALKNGKATPSGGTRQEHPRNPQEGGQGVRRGRQIGK
jgi:hypothetical protein